MIDFPIQALYPPMLGGLGFPSQIVQDATPVVATPVKENEPATRNAFSGTSFYSGMFPGFGLNGRLSPFMYQRMRQHPMIVKVFYRIVKPVVAGDRNIEVEDLGAGEELCNTIKDAATSDLLPMLREAMPGAVESLIFGHWLTEIVWGPKDGRIAPVKVKSVFPTEAIIHVDAYREFTGYDLAGQWRDARYGFLAVHDPHFDPVLGKSCCDAAVIAFLREIASSDNADSIERRASGIQFLFHVMQGVEVVDSLGNVIDGLKLATDFMNAAVTGKSGVIPDMAFSKEAIERNPELAKIPYFRAEQFNWGENGPALMSHIARLVRLDAEIFAAFGVPERAVAEAQHGSRADAESHGDVVLAISEQIHASHCRQWDAQITTRWQQANFAGAKVKVWTRAVQDDPLQEFRQKFLNTRILATAVDPNIDSNIDWRAELQAAGLKLRSEADAKKFLADAQAKLAADQQAKMEQAKATAGAGGSGSNGQNGNGNGNRMKGIIGAEK